MGAAAYVQLCICRMRLWLIRFAHHIARTHTHTAIHTQTYAILCTPHPKSYFMVIFRCAHTRARVHSSSHQSAVCGSCDSSVPFSCTPLRYVTTCTQWPTLAAAAAAAVPYAALRANIYFPLYFHFHRHRSNIIFFFPIASFIFSRHAKIIAFNVSGGGHTIDGPPTERR